MGFLAAKTVFSSLTQKVLEESEKFSCGDEDLDGFFYDDAVSYAKNLFGKSYCYTTGENTTEIVCAFTVANASIFTKYLPNARKKKVGKLVPHIKQDLIYLAVLIGRLGISTKYQHLHLGSEVLDFIKAWFIDPYNKTGCRYLVVDAYNEKNPVAFYKKNGFDFMFSTEEQEKSYRGIVSDMPLKTRLMFFDLIIIK